MEQQDRSAAVDELDPSPAAPGWRGRRVLLGAVAVVALVALGAGITTRLGADGLPGGLGPDTTSPDTTGPDTTGPDTTSPDTTGQPGVPPTGGTLALGPVLPGAHPDWQAVWQTENAVYRVQLATGETVRAGLPEAFEHAAVLAADGDRLLVNLPYAYTFLVDFGRPSAAGSAGPERTGHVDMRPGPPGQVWTLEGGDGIAAPVVLQRRDFDGGPVAGARPLPSGVRPEQVLPDGGGGVLLEQQGGVWQIGEDGYQRLSTGRLVAWGEGGLVFTECDEQLRCSHVARDAGTGRTHRVDAAGTSAPAPLQPTAPAAISPDGRWWLRTTPAEDGYELVDLRTGAADRLDVRADLTPQESGTPTAVLAWTPDSRHLLIGGDRVLVLDVASRDVTEVDGSGPVSAMILTQDAGG